MTGINVITAKPTIDFYAASDPGNIAVLDLPADQVETGCTQQVAVHMEP